MNHAVLLTVSLEEGDEKCGLHMKQTGVVSDSRIFSRQKNTPGTW